MQGGSGMINQSLRMQLMAGMSEPTK